MTSPDAASTLDVAELRRSLADGGEQALVDVREQLHHAEDGHPLLAVSLPWHQVDPHAPALLPRRSVRLVLLDGGPDGLAHLAVQRFRSLGYTDVRVLRGGVAAWRDAGHEVFTGTNAFSKVFGEVVEQRCATPHLGPAQLREAWPGRGVVLIDSRPADEYRRMHIPGALHCPAAELPYRFDDLVPSPDTPVVITCAGRTRGILGAQALRNAGIPNDVRVLHNGTMGWLLDGQVLEPGDAPPVGAPSPSATGRARARALALQLQFDLDVIDLHTLDRFTQDTARTLHVFDVRSPEEYEAGHLPGAASAPGTQLVMLLEDFVGTRHARIVLVDGPDATRATVTASWLAQMDWAEVHVLPLPASAFTERTLARPLPASGARWVSPYLLHDEAARRAGFVEYLRWSAGLLVQFERDRTHRFRVRTHVSSITEEESHT